MSVTPYGRTGPYAGRPATDFTVQAECGSIAGRGVPERPPVQAGGRTSEWAAGLYAATAGLAALLGVRAGAPGTAVDVSWLEAMTVSTNLYADPMWSIMTALMGIDPPGDPRSVETPSIYPTADGWIGFNTNGPQHAEAFLRLIERDDLIDEGYVNAGTRTGNRHEFDELGPRLDHATSDRGDPRSGGGPARADGPGERRRHGARRGAARARARLLRAVARRRRPGAAGPLPHRRRAAAVPGPGSGPRCRHGGRSAPASGRRRRPRSSDGPAPTATRPLAGSRCSTSRRGGPARRTRSCSPPWAPTSSTSSRSPIPTPCGTPPRSMFLDRDRWWELSSFYININITSGASPSTWAPPTAWPSPSA